MRFISLNPCLEPFLGIGKNQNLSLLITIVVCLVTLDQFFMFSYISLSLHLNLHLARKLIRPKNAYVCYHCGARGLTHPNGFKLHVSKRHLHVSKRQSDKRILQQKTLDPVPLFDEFQKL